MLVTGTEAMDSRSKMSQGCGGDDEKLSHTICHSPQENLCPALEDRDGTGVQELSGSRGFDYCNSRHPCLFP